MRSSLGLLRVSVFLAALPMASSGCGGSDEGGDGGGGAGGTAEGEIRVYLTMDAEETTPFPLRSGVLFTDAYDGVDKIGLTSFSGARCEVGDWWLREDDWAYVIVDEDPTLDAEVHFGVQRSGRFLGGTEHLNAELVLDSMEPTEEGGAEGQVTFEDFADESPRGSASFVLPYCGTQEP